MPCEPVASGVPPTPSRPSSPPAPMHPTTSSRGGLGSYRMKPPRSGVGGGARRALTALGTNDTSLNVRLAKSLLTISQDKFAKKWNFDPVREMPLGQSGGRFQWMPTGTLGLDSGLGCHSSGSSGLLSLFSHDLGATGAVEEAEEKAAALRRTCLNLPQAPDLPSYTTTITATVPPPPDTLNSAEPRVPPPHPDDPLPTPKPTPTQSETTTDGPNISSSSSSSSRSRSAVTPSNESRRKVCATINMQGGTELIQPITTSEPSSSSSSRVTTTVGIASDASSRVVIDKEHHSTLQDNNQCQTSIIDPTDTSHQHSTVRTQACITNYLRPRKRSSAHLQEAVHPSKTKKGSCRGIV